MRLGNMRPKSRFMSGIANAEKSNKGSIGPSDNIAQEMISKVPKKKKMGLFMKKKKMSSMNEDM